MQPAEIPQSIKASVAAVLEAEFGLQDASAETASTSLTWQPLAIQGTTNQLWLLGSHHQTWVLRVNAPSQWAFGVNREQEMQLLVGLQQHAWAPRVIAVTPEWLLQDYCGPHLLHSPEPEEVMAMVQQMHDIHQAPVVDYDALFTHYRELFQQHQVQPELDLLNRLTKAFDKLPACEPCLVHHDIHPGNLCLLAGKLTLIDWEYGGLGNPWLELPNLHHLCDLDLQRLHQLPAFSDLSYENFLQFFHGANEVMTGLEALWNRARALATHPTE